MKHTIKIFFALFFLIGGKCCAQQIMKTVADAQKVKVNEKLFIDKPLKTLLKEIKPEIKMVSGNPSESNQVRLGYLIFKFVDYKQNDSIKAKGKVPVAITVFVKEYFNWDFQEKFETKQLNWSKEDLEEYGNLTVVGIRVYGND